MAEAIKHFLYGASSVFQIWPNTGDRLRERFLDRTDEEALYHDWEKVGNDMKSAMGTYDHESRA